MSSTFLSAEWRKLLVFNYEVDKSVLDKYLPANTELDLWNNTCYISLVGFMFLNTKLKGIKVPLHVNFEEINLRFYVRHKEKRGVVFIKEIVPKRALTFVANTLYKENYQTLSTSHKWIDEDDNLFVEYCWNPNNLMNIISANTSSVSVEILPESEAEFIFEHYWGYTKISENKTSEYEVQHPRWNVYSIKDHSIQVDFKNTYGEDFAFLNSEKPVSVFLAEGSEIRVMQGTQLK